ncbi:uncharacterized protein METZ01_LOCUS374209, partial [marine metagenome]
QVYCGFPATLDYIASVAFIPHLS